MLANRLGAAATSLAAATVILLVGFTHDALTTGTKKPQPDGPAKAGAPPAVPLGLPPLPVPPSDPAVVELGKKLFFDRRLSANNTMSCGMCHVEDEAFTSNQLGASVGMEGRSVKRNAPTIFNVVYEKTLFRDGRESALETQVWSPMLAHNEMAAPSVGWVLDVIRSLPNYQDAFKETYPERGITMDTVGEAIAAYERSLLLANSPFDRWHYGGEDDALTPEEIKGFELFTGKAGCAACHTIGPDSALFSDQKFHATGLGYTRTMGLEDDHLHDIMLAPGKYTKRSEGQLEMISRVPENDIGRFEITRKSDDRWAYKTPSLRNIELTRPYMHDGSFLTLEEVVAFYDVGGHDSPTRSPLIKPLNLDQHEKEALVAFLKSLTGTPETSSDTSQPASTARRTYNSP
ncbi:MAG: cytochrome c peroxidase [Pseudomonadota bacterium]